MTDDLRARARELDAADPLAAYRDAFVTPADADVISYLDGNSLGRPLAATADLMDDFIRRQWAGRLIRGWTDEWLDWPLTLGDRLASVALGAAGGQTVIADSTSGVSGAGRSPALKSLFCEVTYQPYGVLSHRHAPEIIEHSGADVVFTPHLAPFDRGIASTIHATLVQGWTEEMVRDALQQAFGDEPFVRLLPAGAWPTVGAVRGTNFCDIALAVDPQRHHLIVVSAIDNLLKGAAGQAVQCLNIRFDLPHTAGFAGAGMLAAPRKDTIHA